MCHYEESLSKMNDELGREREKKVKMFLKKAVSNNVVESVATIYDLLCHVISPHFFNG